MPRLRLMLFATAAAIAVAVGANYLANPFGAWRVNLIDPQFRAFGDERVAIPYMLRVASPETVLIGDSRVFSGMPIDQGMRDGVLNAALRGATMDEMIEIAKLAARNKRLERVVFEADFPAFDAALEGVHQDDSWARLSGNGAVVTETLLSLDALSATSKVAIRALAGRSMLDPTQSAPVPWPYDLICSELDKPERRMLDRDSDAEIQLQLLGSAIMIQYAGFRLSARQTDRFTNIVTELRRNSTEVILFVPPMSEYELEMIRQTGHWAAFKEWERDLLKAGDYVDYSGYSELARAERMFTETVHFNSAVGELILHELLGDSQGPRCGGAAMVHDAAVKVTSRSVDEVLTLQEARRDAAVAADSKFSVAVAKSLATRGIAMGLKTR